MANPLLREGPLPAFVHGGIEYVAGILFIAAPTALSFEESSNSTVVSLVVGIVILIVAASSALPTGLMKTIPIYVHLVLDFVLAVFLIGAPFVFDFVDDKSALVFFLVVGVAHLLITIATRFERAPAASRPAGSAPRR
ncbi:MAG: SPW repeat domain-containing protein [Actinomycetota bacterium]